MRAFKLIAMSIIAAGSLLANELKPPSTNAAVNVPTTDVLLREVHYDGKLSDSEAKFTVAIDAESLKIGRAHV